MRSHLHFGHLLATSFVPGGLQPPTLPPLLPLQPPRDSARLPLLDSCMENRFHRPERLKDLDLIEKEDNPSVASSFARDGRRHDEPSDATTSRVGYLVA
eukprot:COSAG06_NODE_43868_length_368_cov_0.799257_1_plen_98_part_10